MTSFIPQDLKARASVRLEPQRSSARRLVLLYTGVVVLLNLAASGLSLYLDSQIEGTGGLSGLGTRSVLQTIQTVLQYGSTLFTPFWSAGFLLAILRIADRETVQPQTLLQGFKRFLPILSYNLLLMALYFGLAMGCASLASVLFVLSPFSNSLSTLLSGASLDLTAIPADTLLTAYFPMLVIYAILLIPALAVLHYSLRLSIYFIMDHSQMSGMRAMLASARAMRGHKLKMLRLDLSFWWYYLLEAVLVIICYLDLFLPLLGVTLPFNETSGFFFFLILYSILEVALHLWKKPDVDTVYALAYRAITTPDDHASIIDAEM